MLKPSGCKYIGIRKIEFVIIAQLNFKVYRSLTTYPTYRLWSPMLRFLFDNIKLYNDESAEYT